MDSGVAGSRHYRGKMRAVTTLWALSAVTALVMLCAVSPWMVLTKAVVMPETLEKGRIGSSDVKKYKPNEVLVRFRKGVSESAVGAAHASIGAEVVKTYRGVENLQLVRLPANISVEEAIRRYRQNPDVLYAQPNYTVRALENPNRTRAPGKQDSENTRKTKGDVDNER